VGHIVRDYRLVTTHDEIAEFGELIREKAFLGKYYGWDVETNSLNTRRARLVGTSIAPIPGLSCYIPIGHQLGTNADAEWVKQLFRDLTEEGFEPVAYNSKFDLNVIQANWRIIFPICWDSLELVYLEDPDRKVKKIDVIAAEDLNMELASFESLFTPAENKAKKYDLSKKTPGHVCDYAAEDADAAIRIWELKQSVKEEFSFAVDIDRELVEIVRALEHNGGMELNPEYVEEQMEILGKRAKALEEQIYRMVGERFLLDSPKKLGIALFERAGLPHPEKDPRTKTGQWKTGKAFLEKVAAEHPLAEFVISYRKIVKARGTYFKKLLRLKRLKLKPRFSFHLHSAPTFRFAAPGGDPLKDGFTGVNIQAVSNGEARTLNAVDLSKRERGRYAEELVDSELMVASQAEEVSIEEWTGDKADLPWVTTHEDHLDQLFCFRESCSGCPANCAGEGIDVTRRPEKNLVVVPSVRQAFRAPEGYTLVSLDYDRQELVIAANMSGEPNWLRALAAGLDVHAQTAALGFGHTKDDFERLKDTNPGEWARKRDGGKIANFATLYGGTAYTVAKQTGMSQSAAEAFYNGLVRNHPTLFNWISRVQAFARQKGYTTTYFGRKRWLKKYYERVDRYGRPDRKMIGFANRSAVNTAIQGTGAEVTRIAMVRVEKLRLKKGYSHKDMRLVIQLHDELTYLVRDEIVDDVIELITEGMEFKVKSWEVQLSVGVKVGPIWGIQKKWERKEIAA